MKKVLENNMSGVKTNDEIHHSVVYDILLIYVPEFYL